MLLKREVIQMPFSKKKNFEIIYENEFDLKAGIIEICNILKKDKFIIQVFSKDELNKILGEDHEEKIKDKNYHYYIKENLDFLDGVAISNIRFLNIYSISVDNQRINLGTLQKILNNASFCLGLDNYLEDTKIIVDFNYYGEKSLIDFVK